MYDSLASTASMAAVIKVGATVRVSATYPKARSTQATMSKQRSTLLPKNGNNVEQVLRWNFVISTKSNVAPTFLPVSATISNEISSLWSTLFDSERNTVFEQVGPYVGPRYCRPKCTLAVSHGVDGV